MMFRTEAAIQEHERHQEANRLLEGGGCWISSDSPSEKCLGKSYDESDVLHECCESCPAYIEFYKVADSYQEEPGIAPSEAVWLAEQFYGIKSSYMCNGEDGEWLKQYNPTLYKQLLKRQERLMDGHFEENLSESKENLQKSDIQGQMTIEDWFREAES